MECPNVTLWHWPFTYDRDLQTWPQHPSIWPPYQNSRLYICPFGWGSETDSRPDTHRETHNVKTITPITSETWGVMIASSRQKEASFSLLVGTTHFWMGFYVPWVWEFSEVAAAWAIVHHFHKISKFFLSDPWSVPNIPEVMITWSFWCTNEVELWSPWSEKSWTLILYWGLV